MANLSTPNIQWLRNLPPGELPSDFGQRMYEIVSAHQTAINQVASQTNATASGTTAAPPPISALSVRGNATGLFDIQIQDNNPVEQGINYFVEYSTTPSFSQPYVLDLGPSRNGHVTMAGITLYFRAYSQYRPSQPSTTVYFGSAGSPTPVNAGGATVATVLQSSTGSGTATNTGTQGGVGFGVGSRK